MNEDHSGGWFKAMRSQEARELIRKKPNAYLLACVIASRARWNNDYNADGLEQGEALLGDHNEYGMSRQEYRTAQAQLVKGYFATVKTTSRGTIARLIDTRLFDPANLSANHQSNQRPTISQPSANHRPTTNNNNKKIKEGEESPPPVITSSAASNLENRDGGLLAKDRERLLSQIKDQRESVKPDPDIAAGLRAELILIENELRRRGKHLRELTANAGSVPPPPMTPTPRPAIAQKPDAKPISDHERKKCGAALKKLREGLWKPATATDAAGAGNAPP